MGVYLDVKKSLQRDLVTFSLTHLTDYQATSDPVADADSLGKFLYRTDLDKLFQVQQGVTQLGYEWVEIDYDSLFFDFDSHAQAQSLPEKHIVGTKAISASVSEHVVEMGLLIGVSIYNDTNFKRHDQVLDALLTRYLPTKQIQIYRFEDGIPSGNLQILDGTEVMPMAKADQRPLQFLAVSLLSNRTLDLS